jgi:uncharacterized BrkB/YihY/UPF0761 family membrane protein
VLIWVYYTAQLVLMGAEFTNVYARRYGSQRDAAATKGRVGQGKSAEMERARRLTQMSSAMRIVEKRAEQRAVSLPALRCGAAGLR